MSKYSGCSFQQVYRNLAQPMQQMTIQERFATLVALREIFESAPLDAALV